jgi:hypothetical protein
VYGNVFVYKVTDRLEVLCSKDGWVVEVLWQRLEPRLPLSPGDGLTVMRSVFDGGEGVTRAGRSERSSDSGVRGVEPDGEDRRLDMVPVLSGGSEDFAKAILV